MNTYGIVAMNKSATYKFKVPTSEHSIYLTIVGNNSFFVNCKEMKSFEYVTPLMTAYSKLINSGIPIKEVIQDMKEAFDPRGPYIMPGTNIKVNSIIHHFGLILEKHYNVGLIMEELDNESDRG